MGDPYQDNVELNARETGAGAVELSSKPVGLVVALTTRCNIDCVMCNVKDMRWDLPERTIGEITALFPYLGRISWQGGEVFLHKGFKRMVLESLRYPRLVHSITTNGHLLSDEWLELFNRVRVDLNISIDAVSKATYEQIRKGSTFENVIRNLERIREKGINGRRNLIVTVMKRNLFQLGGFVKFAGEYGFSSIIFQQARSHPGNRSDELLFAGEGGALHPEILETMRTLRSEGAERGIFVVDCLTPKKADGEGTPAPAAERPAGELFCNAPWRQLFIGWEGYVYPSCLCLRDDGADRAAVGNVLTDRLEAIWNGERMKEYRRAIARNDCRRVCGPQCVNGVTPRALRDVKIGD